MKTVIILAAFVALALANTVPTYKHTYETKPVDATFVAHQKKVFELFYNAYQVNVNADYYKIGKDYDVEANIEKYTNKKAVEEFLTLYKSGFMPKIEVFSIFYERMGEEAIALFHLFYYAKDFETFYKTAAFARVHFNTAQFLYSYYIAVIHRPDCKYFVLPAPYEVYPQLFSNTDVEYKVVATQMQDGLMDPASASHHGITYENDYYVYYANYSGAYTYGQGEQRISYFTEDIGLNSYYYYFHSYWPFWMKGEHFGLFKEHRGEGYYYIYQQLLARYYLERLSNGLGEIPEFSWFYPIKSQYVPKMAVEKYPFLQRSPVFEMQNEQNYDDMLYLDTYERSFIQFLEKGHFKAYNQEIDFHNSKAINFVGNYWQANADLYTKVGPRNFWRTYETVARRLLSAAPETFDKYHAFPASLNFFQTSARDPMFYQLYKRVMKYFFQYKEYLDTYNQEQLHFVGVKINDVKVDQMVTYFDFFDYSANNLAFYSNEEFKTQDQTQYRIRQPRLNHKLFTVSVDIKSDFDGEAVFKFFLGPKYDSNGFPISLEENWMNFVELDWFVQNVTRGQNKVERSSDDFFFYKEDSIPMYDIMKLVEQGKVPTDMSEHANSFPNRLMLPKGTKGGFPFQLFVFAYPYNALDKSYEPFKNYIIDNKPFGYPLDRPVNEIFFKQPNMFFEDVLIYHDGEDFPYKYNTPKYYSQQNAVPKH